MIRLDHVSRRWQEFSIQDVTLEVEEGQYLVIVGPTGAGKTLLLELLLGIHKPDQGRLFINGEDVTAFPPEKRAIGMVYQDYLLFPHLDVEKNLAFGLRYQTLTREEKEAKIRQTARLLGIEHLLHRYQYTLSGGERQRVAIGRAIITEPRMLLLDEPLSALDRGTSRRLRDELKLLHKTKNLTVIHVTHDLSEARQLADRIAVMNAGQVTAFGTMTELLRRPRTLFVANFVGAINLFPGTLTRDGDEMNLVAGPMTAKVTGRRGDSNYLMVLPDEIEVLSLMDTTQAKNRFPARVIAITDEGSHLGVMLKVDGLEEPLTAYVTRQMSRQESLYPGCEIMADAANALHVVAE